MLIIRLALGLGMAAHGAQKAFGVWGGHGPQGTVAMMRSLRYRPPEVWAMTLIVTELIGGLCLAIGALTPVAAAVMLAAMAHAAYRVHLRNGFFAMSNGIEVPVLYFAGALAVLIAGPGAYSVDGAAGITWSQPLTAILALVAALIGACAPMATRELEQRTATTAG